MRMAALSRYQLMLHPAHTGLRLICSLLKVYKRVCMCEKNIYKYIPHTHANTHILLLSPLIWETFCLKDIQWKASQFTEVSWQREGLMVNWLNCQWIFFTTSRLQTWTACRQIVHALKQSNEYICVHICLFSLSGFIHLDCVIGQRAHCVKNLIMCSLVFSVYWRHLFVSKQLRWPVSPDQSKCVTWIRPAVRQLVIG